MPEAMSEEEFSAEHDAVSGQNRFAAAYHVLDEAIRAHGFPGCAFGVWADGKILLIDALGRFRYERDAPVVQPATVYDLASLTKVVATTAAAMLLVQRGKLDVDSPVGDLLREFVEGRKAGDLARQITVRHLLAHNSGLPGYVEFFRAAETPAEVFRICMRLRLETAPGARAEYSDPGFILLGKALEVCMSEALDVWVGREIFAPMGLKSTGYCPALEKRGSIPPTGVDERFRRRLIQGEVQDENAFVLGGVAGHAGIFSNVGDLLRFSAEILNASTGARLFDPATIDMFAERQSPEGSSRALGWDTPSEKSSSGRYFSRRSIGHLGYSGTSLWIDLEAGIAVVLLTNRTWPDRKSQLIREVRPAFHDAVREAL